MTNFTWASKKRSKHRVFWRALLSLNPREYAGRQHHVSHLPIVSTSTSSPQSPNANQIPPNLVRSNARAKTPKNSQTRKTARTESRCSNMNKEDKLCNLVSRTSPDPRRIMAKPDAKIRVPSPPPYVLSLPEAVVQPPSLVALTNDELRSRGIYSPHPAVGQGSAHTQSCMPGVSISRNTSFRSALTMLTPRLGLRPAISSGNSFSHSRNHARDHPSLLASAILAIGVCVSVMMISLDRGSITTAIPSILIDLNSFQDMGWYGSAYLLAVSAFQPMYGRVYTSFNIKWSFLGAVTMFELGALLCAIAPSSKVFILGRAVQGLGSAGISTGSSAIITHNFDLKARLTLLAFLNVFSWSSAIAGPVLGGAFAQLLSWKWCYYLNLILAGTTFGCVLFFSNPHDLRVPRPGLVRQTSDFSSTGKTFARRISALDWTGSFLLITACTFLLLALQLWQQKESDRASSQWMIFAGLAATFILLSVLWMQMRGDNALIPFHVLRQRTMAVLCAAAFFLHGAFTIHIYFLPIWFRLSKQQSAIESSVATTPYMLIMAIFTLVSGRLVFGSAHLTLFVTLGCGLATIGSGLISMLGPEASILACVGYQTITAAGLGMAMQKSLSAVQAALPPHEVSIGTAIFIACQNAGGAVFVSIGNALFQRFLFQDNNIAGSHIPLNLKLTDLGIFLPEQARSDTQEHCIDAFRAVFVATISLCGIAFLFSMCIKWHIAQDDQASRTPGLMNMQGIDRGFDSPGLSSDAPTLAHLAPRARHRWSQRWSLPMTDVEVGPRRLTTVLQDLNDSECSLLSIEDATNADIKEMEIGVAIST